MTAVLDSTVLIDVLRGMSEAQSLVASVERPRISIVTWMEVLAGARSNDEDAAFRDFLRAFEVVQLVPEISEHAVVFRRERRLKLPDAVILATARHLGLPLLTRNSRDFPADDPLVRIPYTL